jgi:hypothetical protein
VAICQKWFLIAGRWRRERLTQTVAAGTRDKQINSFY